MGIRLIAYGSPTLASALAAYRRGVSAPSKAGRFLRGESPLWEGVNHPVVYENSIDVQQSLDQRLAFDGTEVI